jgi:ribosomal protein S27E
MRCDSCGSEKKTIRAKWSDVDIRCESCGDEMSRVVAGPEATVMEKLDNGIMPRAIERNVRAEQLLRERARNAPREAGAAIQKAKRDLYE